MLTHGAVSALHHLGKLLALAGRAAEAEPLLREALAGWQTRYGSDYRRAKNTALALGQCLIALGQTAEARPLLAQGQAGRPLH